MTFISVDLPEPEAPITETSSPRADVEVEALEDMEGVVPHAVALVQFADADHRFLEETIK